MMKLSLRAVEPLTDNFLLFVDPVMKGLYQVDLATIGSGGAEQVRGIDVRTSNVPARAAFDVASRHLYWHDSEYDGLNVIKRMSLAGDIAEHSLIVLAPGIVFYAIDREFEFYDFFHF